VTEAYPVEIGGRPVRLTNLTKVMYPATGTTKAGVVDYYRRVAPALLAQLHDRPVTRIRWPDGVAGGRFFEKNVPAGAPAWLRRRAMVMGEDDYGTEITYPFLDDLAGLVWAANAGALELHTPQWRVGPRGAVGSPDRLVIDLDPGAPAGLDDCARVALLVADRLRSDGLDPLPVTSGSKGLQLYAALDGRRDAMAVREYARGLAQELARAHPRLVVATMTKELRRGKVLLDWSQNHPSKTTITPYSLRGRERPTVAAPRTWEEVASGGLTQLEADAVARRLEDNGDLLAG
jgi:bifunctional non-homologous end joining protein LigD